MGYEIEQECEREERELAEKQEKRQQFLNSVDDREFLSGLEVTQLLRGMGG